MTYDEFILSLKRLAERPRSIGTASGYSEQHAIDFVVGWFEANQDDVREFLEED